jgi:hypothetical protein
MFIAILFIIAKLWKQPSWPTTDEWIKKLWCIHTQWTITQPQGVVWKQHTEWRKPGSETQKPYVFSDTWKIDPKINRYIKRSMIIYKLRRKICL